jgi:hypothetical protein
VVFDNDWTVTEGGGNGILRKIFETKREEETGS